MLAFTSVNFLETSLFNGLQPFGVKKFWPVKAAPKPYEQNSVVIPSLLHKSLAGRRLQSAARKTVAQNSDYRKNLLGSCSVDCWSGLNVGKAVMACLLPATHAERRKISRPLGLPSCAYAEAAGFSWVAGSSPARTAKQNYLKSGAAASTETPIALQTSTIPTGKRQIRSPANALSL
jgi:hypothetical protein